MRPGLIPAGVRGEPPPLVYNLNRAGRNPRKFRRHSRLNPESMSTRKSSRGRAPKPVAHEKASRAAIDAAEQWLRGHRKILIGAILAVSIALRAGYYAEVRQGPSLAAHLWVETDMNFFDRWARVIAGGDWLVNRELHPLSQWQATMAQEHFRLHPEQIAEYERAGVPKDDRRALYQALWNHWDHGKEYHQEPLYAYLIAITYKVFTPDVRWVFAWQMLLGILINVSVYLLARRYFGELTGAVAAVLIVFYSPLFFYELTLVRTTLTTFLGVALLAGMEWAMDRDSPRRWFAVGAGFGISLLCQTTFGAMFAGCLGWLLMKHRGDLRAGLRLVGFAIAGALVAVSPVMLRNFTVGVPLTQWASNGTQTILTFNAASFDPASGYAVGFSDEVRIMGETDGKVLPVVIATVKDHASPWGLVRLLLLKFEKLWNWYEEPDNQNFYYYRLHSWVLRYAPFTSYAMSPLLLVGLALGVSTWKRSVPLYLLAFTGILVGTLIYPSSRYRVQYFGPMLIFAALTIARGIEWLCAKRWGRAGALLACVAAAFLWTSAPLPASRRMIRVADYAAPYEYYWVPLHEAAAGKQDWRGAARILEGSFRYEPDEVKNLGPGRACQTEEDAQLASFYSNLHDALAKDLKQAGDTSGAGRESNRALELANAARACTRA